MYGDTLADLFHPNTFRTGDDDRTETTTPIRFDWAAYDHAIRLLQPSDLPGPSWARQYPLYLRTIARIEGAPVQLMVEDRTHRRPGAIDPLILSRTIPISDATQALLDAFAVQRVVLGI